MTKTLGVTLARGGSKGIPHKNIAMVAGKPLIAWTIEEALKSSYISRYLVSSDSEEILQVAKEYGAEPLKRPYYLAGDKSPTIDGLLHALRWAEEEEHSEYDIIADLRATNPLKTVDDIDGAIDKLVHTGADVVCGVSQLDDHHPARIKMVVADHLVDVWPEPEGGQRQDLRPKVYIRNGSLYVVRRNALLEGVLIGRSEEIRPWFMPPEKGVNVDSSLDLMLVDLLLRQRDVVRG